MASPLVTVIVPVYNAGDYLYHAVVSVIKQTHKNLEIIVIDDGSTDDCISTIVDIDDNRLKTYKQENKGKSSAMNHAFKIMKGDYWMIQDADDLSHKERVDKLVNYMEENKELAAVFSGNDLMLNNKVFAPRSRSFTKQEFKGFVQRLALPAHDATGLYRTESTRNLLFDEKLRVGQGVDYIFRLLEKYHAAVFGECLYTVRINYDSNTHKSANRNIEYINKVFYDACSRRGMNYQHYKLKPKKERRFFKHRDFDNYLSYATDSVGQSVLNGDYKTAFNTSKYCVFSHPLDPLYYKPLLYMLLPKHFIRKKRSD